MWACSKGYGEAALALFRWNHSALELVNIYNQSALDLARASGFNALATEVNKLNNDRQKQRALSPSSQSKLAFICIDYLFLKSKHNQW